MGVGEPGAAAPGGAGGQMIRRREGRGYPVEARAYRLLDEIGSGVSAVVYKAACLPLDLAVVAIKSIDLERSRANLEDVRREAKAMALLSHPNVLTAHCSFTVGSRLWVVMPFMAAGSLQSIISSAFPDGLSEPCIAVILRETLQVRIDVTPAPPCMQLETIFDLSHQIWRSLLPTLGAVHIWFLV